VFSLLDSPASAQNDSYNYVLLYSMPVEVDRDGAAKFGLGFGGLV